MSEGVHARPPRVPAELFAAVQYFLPRLMFLNARYAPQIHWGDVTRALDGFPCDDLDLGSAAFWSEWRVRWTAQGAGHERRAGLAASRAGRARALRAAAACYHWAEFMDFDDPAVKQALRSRVRHCFRRSLDGSGLDVTEGALALADGSATVPYFLVLPPRAHGPVPCVVLSNGLDSMTEVEVLSLAEPHLDRGVAALLFDGPGQGIDLGRVPLRVAMETVVAELVGVLRDDPRIAADRLAFMGVSFGGYLALRVARALDDTFLAVVNFSGGPRVAPFAGLPRRLKDDFRFALTAGLDPAHDVQALLDRLALDPAGPPDTDVLSVHGARDDIFPLADLVELDRAWGDRHRLVVHEREAHVCLHQIDACSQEAADWVADRLHTAVGDRRSTSGPVAAA